MEIMKTELKKRTIFVLESMCVCVSVYVHEYECVNLVSKNNSWLNTETEGMYADMLTTTFFETLKNPTILCL